MTLDHVSPKRTSLILDTVTTVSREVRRIEDDDQLARVRAELRLAISQAHRAGHSYRAIAQAAGLSHQRIAQLLQKEEK